MERLTGICVRNNQYLDKDQIQRLLKCLNMPFQQVQRKPTSINSGLFADMLQDKDLFLYAASSLWLCLGEKERELPCPEMLQKTFDELIFEYMETDLRDQNGNLWEAGLQNLFWMIEYLADTGCCFSNDDVRRNRSMLQKRKTMERLWSWYRDHIVSEEKCHDMAKKYFAMQFRMRKNKDAMLAFAVFVTIDEMGKQTESETLRNLYMELVKRVQEEDFLLSTMDWACFRKETGFRCF